MKIESTQINFFKSRSLLAVPVLLIFLLMTSCSMIGLVAGGGMQSFTGSYTIELESSHPNILDVIADVGQSMSLDISSMDASRGHIAFSTGSSMGATMLVGSSSDQSLSVTSSNGGKKLDISVMVLGNFNAGSKEAGDRLFSDFKSRLLEKVK